MIPPKAKREAILYMATDKAKAWKAKEILWCMNHHGATIKHISYMYKILDGWVSKGYLEKLSGGTEWKYYGVTRVGYRLTRRGLALARRLGDDATPLA